MRALEQLNNAAARAARKIETAHAATEKAFNRLGDITQVLYKSARRRPDPDVLTSLGAVVATLDSLAITSLVGTTTAHYVWQHAGNVHKLLQQQQRLRRPRAAPRQKHEGAR